MKRVIAAMRGRDVTNPNHRGKANENYRQRLYKQAGNGVTVNVIEAIAKRFEGEE